MKLRNMLFSDKTSHGLDTITETMDAGQVSNSLINPSLQYQEDLSCPKMLTYVRPGRSGNFKNEYPNLDKWMSEKVFHCPDCISLGPNGTFLRIL